MGLTNAALNFMYFIFILNISLALVSAAYPQFRYIDISEKPELNATLQQLENVNPDSPLQLSAFSVLKTFFSSVLSGNYYLWKALGMDDAWANALRTLTYLSYVIVMVAILFGRVL